MYLCMYVCVCVCVYVCMCVCANSIYLSQPIHSLNKKCFLFKELLVALGSSQNLDIINDENETHLNHEMGNERKLKYRDSIACNLVILEDMLYDAKRNLREFNHRIIKQEYA